MSVLWKVVGLGVCFFTLPLSGWARDWVRFDVPHTVCGDGSPYRAFYSQRNPERLLVYVKGGGACWNKETCFGPLKLTNVEPPETMTLSSGFLSDDPSFSPVTDYSILYLPYCTGDVYVGRHVSSYQDKVVHHTGAINVENTFATFRDRFGFRNFKDVVFYGYSAGAISALLHLNTLGPFLAPGARRTAVLDSPGLHFGNSFWNKFSPAMQRDFETALGHLGIPFDPRDGMLVARNIGQICRYYNDWTIGFLQGDQDFVMSLVFGSTTPRKHRKAVFSDVGMVAQTDDPTDNCSAWVPRSLNHMFFLNRLTTKIKAGHKSAFDFATDLVNGRAGPNFTD